ncbi:MAG: Clp protease N-terminal domain-containing protein [Dehalococcoidia bacterium]
MDLSRYSAESQEIFRFAEEEALTLRHGQIGTHHLLIALIRVGAFPGDAREARLAVREATFELEPRIEDLPETIPFSFGSRQFLDRAEELAGDAVVTPEHLAESMRRQSGHVVSVLHRMGIFLY